MTSLAEIEREIGNVLAVAEELDTTQQPTALDYLEALALQEAEKVDAVSFAVRRRKRQIEWLQDEERRLRRLRQAMEHRLEAFRDYLVGLMQGHGLRSLRGNAGSLSLREVSSVAILDLQSVPATFKDVVVEERPRKLELREALVAGQSVPGAALLTRTTLTVR